MYMLALTENKKTNLSQIRLKIALFLSIVTIGLMQSGCTSVKTFTSSARAGDTIMATYKLYSLKSTRDNTKISIEDANNVVTTYYPGDERIRAILNLYPDPISYLVVATETSSNIRNSETQLGSHADSGSHGTRDWYQTMAFIDMPNTIAPGIATITINSNDYIKTTQVNIIEGVGEKHEFIEDINPAGPTHDERLQSLERAPYSSVKISGENSINVHAVDITFTHNADFENGGQGKAHVVSPRGDIGSINWHDTGTELHVVVTPAHDQILNPRANLQFYVAGGLTGLKIQNAIAYDVAGDVVPDIVFKVSPLAHSLSPSGTVFADTVMTLNGDNLCHDCEAPDSDVWLLINDMWNQITPLSVNENSISFLVPDTAAAGKGAVWVGTPAGETDMWFDIESTPPVGGPGDGLF